MISIKLWGRSGAIVFQRFCCFSEMYMNAWTVNHIILDEMCGRNGDKCCYALPLKYGWTYAILLINVNGKFCSYVKNLLIRAALNSFQSSDWRKNNTHLWHWKLHKNRMIRFNLNICSRSCFSNDILKLSYFTWKSYINGYIWLIRNKQRRYNS